MKQQSIFKKKHNIDFVLGTLNEDALGMKGDKLVDITDVMPSTTKYLQSLCHYAEVLEDDGVLKRYSLDGHVWLQNRAWRTFADPEHDYREVPSVRGYNGYEFIKSCLKKAYSSDAGATLVLCDKEFASKLATAVRTLCSKGHLVHEDKGIVYAAGQTNLLTALFIAGDYPQNKKAKRVLLTAYDSVLCIYAAVGQGSWKLLYKTEGDLPTEFTVIDSTPIRRVQIPRVIKVGWVTPSNKTDKLSVGENFYNILKEEPCTAVSAAWRNAIC